MTLHETKTADILLRWQPMDRCAKSPAAAAGCRGWLPTLLVTLIACTVIGERSLAQDRRRVLRTPGLVVETGAPTSSTRVLTFTAKGDQLLAAGHDKTVRVWPVDDGGKIDRSNSQALRWSIYRQQRGKIYAMALSPDKDQNLVVVGGVGIRNGSLSVIDRKSGEVVYGLTEPDFSTWVTALRFAPSGEEIAIGTSEGAVRIWDLKRGKNRVRKLGAHGSTSVNRIVTLAYQDDGRLVSVAEDGTLQRWDPQSVRQTDSQREPLKIGMLQDAVIGGDGKWLAASGRRSSDDKWCVEIRDLQTDRSRIVTFKKDYYPKQLAFDAQAERLAVGVHRAPADPQPYKAVTAYVTLYNVKSKEFDTDNVPPLTYLSDALAFSPNGRFLAVAGGDDYEIVVWDFERRRVADRIRSVGQSIWQVALSPDKSQLGFRQQRASSPTGFNSWGTGDWRLFDLQRRNWANDLERQQFRPVEPLETASGWRVEPDGSDPFTWYVVHDPTGQREKLPLDRNMVNMPRCYTFLKSQGSKPVRIVVGHDWGMSMYALRGGQRPELARIFVGHEGEVYSVAPSSDQTILVSASRDQTIAGWTLADWPHQSELGVRFEKQGEALAVQDVAAGSPGWEAGLIRGDVLDVLAYRAKKVTGGVADMQRILRSPQPGWELYFEVRREGSPELVKMLTTVRQRPLWQFFPAQDEQWVLWRWRDFYYDCSVRGDELIGWQVNGDVDETPTFTRAEQNRERFFNPGKVEDVLTQMAVAPQRVAEPELVQPKVDLSIESAGDGSLVATVEARARSGLFSSEPVEVSLWINDYKHRRWLKPTVPFKQTIRISGSDLRSGKNYLLAEAYSGFGARGDSSRKLVEHDRRDELPAMHSVCIGINDYSGTAPSSARGDRWSELWYARQDAVAVGDLLGRQTNSGLYREVTRPVVMVDAGASREQIIRQLKRIAEVAKPDDVFVLFMAGHGWARKTGQSSFDSGSFAFVAPEFDVRNSLKTGLRFARDKGSEEVSEPETLFELLTAIPSHKLLVLDCCHSGGSTVMIRDLTPNPNVGPTIVVACSKDEQSWDLTTKGHGAFTASLIESLDEKFSEVDQDADARLDASELARAIERRVPRLIDLARPILQAFGLRTGQTQKPQFFIPGEATDLELFGRAS